MISTLLRRLPKACSITTLAVALYFLVAATLDYEGNFFIFIWRTFAPTTAIFVGITITLGVIIRVGGSRLPSRLTLLTLATVFCATLAPIIQELRFFSPSALPAVRPGDTPFTVFNMNLLGHRDITPQVLPVIRHHNPDIVLLQEVTPGIAEKLQAELGGVYPCQISDPRPGSYGMATLVRHPCESIPFHTESYWIGRPQLTKVIFPSNRTVITVNFHAIHPHALINVLGDETLLGELSNTVKARETAVTELLSFLEQFRDIPSVMGGDLNSTMRNQVYALIRKKTYGDSWLSTHSLADSILHGGTWPFAENGIPHLLAWILRIDFIFYSKQLMPKHVDLVPASLGSDHRGLFGDFVISQDDT